MRFHFKAFYETSDARDSVFLLLKPIVKEPNASYLLILGLKSDSFGHHGSSNHHDDQTNNL